jgi:hypothetical protein
LAHWGGVETTQVRSTDDASSDQGGPLKHPNMLGSRREGHLQRRGQLAKAPLAVGKIAKDHPPRRVGQGMKYAIQDRGFIYNHLV